MTNKQNEVLQFLSKFKSATEEQILFFTKCTNQDINFLLSSNFILKDEKTKLLYLKLRRTFDVRTAVALDVIKLIHNNIKEFNYSKNFPVIFTAITDENKICDIAVVRSIEQETVFSRLKDYTNADKIIIVLENNKYSKLKINTTKEVLICTYPIKIIDKIN